MPLGELPPPAGISPEDWAATPMSVRTLVVALLERLARVEEHVKQRRRGTRPNRLRPIHLLSRRDRDGNRRSAKRAGHPGMWVMGES